VTGYQTRNGLSIVDVAQLQATFENIRTNDPHAAYVEIYENRLWDVQRSGGMVSANDSLVDWDCYFHGVRAAKNLPPERPLSFQHTFVNTGTAPRTLHYVHGSGCADGDPRVGHITVNPPRLPPPPWGLRQTRIAATARVVAAVLAV
jgi:hypothetical protein